MQRSLAIAALCLGLLAAAPASAQVGVHDGMSVGQGPWNVWSQPQYSQRGRYSARAEGGMPPANARCGWFLGRLLGHTRRSLWLAQNWAREFPRSHAAPGKVVVWRTRGIHGHVAQILAMKGSCRATVRDNMGTYDRDICRGVIAYVSA